MKIGKIMLAGEERTLCFSARVLRDCTERYGGVENISEALTQEDSAKVLDECVWLLSRMMDAGARYCRMNGIECAKPLTIDDLYDGCDIADFRTMRTAVMDTIVDNSTPSVEVAEKNAETTREEATS